jgi:outer membrane protein
MTNKEKELKEELLRNKQMQINQYQEAIKLKAKDEEQLLTQTAVNAINDYIKKYGKSKGFKYVLGATGQGNILYADEAQDITEKIIEGLNKDYELDNPE